MLFITCAQLKRLLIASILVAAGGDLRSEPAVNGNLISWPNDGWYQVQTADGNESICNGGRSCTVDPGVYLVINHETGQRFTNIEVGNSADAAKITVRGNTISWPNDGWYQVQTADGSESVCNGGSSCTVDPGVYLVINHETGQRFMNIEVGNSADSAEITVRGNTISWPDDGWYQVQTADGSESVCNGGRSCIVDPGVYLVINHDTGRRFTNIEIAAVNTLVDVQDANIILQAANAADFFSGYYQVLVSSGLVEFPTERMLKEANLSDGSTLVYDNVIDCSGGGMVYLLDETVLTNVPITRITYDNCTVGTTRINGMLIRTSTVRSGQSESFGDIQIEDEQAAIYIDNAYWEYNFSFGVIKFTADTYSVKNNSYSFTVSGLDTELKPDTPFTIPGNPSLIQTFNLVEINGNSVNYIALTNPGFMFDSSVSRATSGSLVLNGTFGDSMIISAHEDPDFYHVNQIASDGLETADIQPWSSIQLFIGPDP